MRRRWAAYAALGWCTDFAFNRALARPRGRPLRAVETSLWMLPVYALIQPLYEPAHDALRHKPPLLRGTAYGVGFTAVEYATGRMLRRLLGAAPWDYSHARYSLHGVVRLDYLPLWAVAGLGLERFHDWLLGN